MKFSNKEIRFFGFTAFLTMILFLFGLVTFAQNVRSDNLMDQVDSITKIIGVLGLIGGAFIGYMQLRIGNKQAELEARLVNMIRGVKDDLLKIIKEENGKLEEKIVESTREMATRRDIDYIKETAKYQHENIKSELQDIKKYLEVKKGV